eukprot:4141392-Prymnesium_polylepis.1
MGGRVRAGRSGVGALAWPMRHAVPVWTTMNWFVQVHIPLTVRAVVCLVRYAARTAARGGCACGRWGRKYARRTTS